MLRRPAPGSRVQLVWEDCFTVDAWTSIDELLAKKPWTVEVVGWFLGRTPDRLWVIATGVDRELHGAATWFIPEKMIREWKAISSE